MAQRPNFMQRWGYGAAPGALVQPPDGTAAAGFATAQRPPAQYFNWLFSNAFAWADYLRGPNVEHWTRTAWGTSPATYDDPTKMFLAVDTVTVDAVGAAYRYVIVGQETSGTLLTARVSRRGNEWTRRTNTTVTATLAPTALAIASSRWLLGADDATIHIATADAGGATGPVGNGSAGDWSAASTPGGMTNVVAFAVRSATEAFALTDDGGVISVDNGNTWTAYTGTSGTARSGNGSDCLWTGSAYVFVTTDGQIYASSTLGGTFAYKTDLGATFTWRLATDGNGGVLAYRAGNGSSLDIFWSADSGATWETITPSSAFIRLQRIRYHEGTWLACSTVAPFLWASNDHETWIKLRMPVSGTDLALYDLAWDGGAWIVVGNGWTLQCPRGMDPSDADSVWESGTTESTLVDAAYLRGNEVSDAPPSDGDVLTWDNAAGVWEPVAPSGGASIPDDLAAVVLDAGNPNTFATLNASGVGTPLSPVLSRALMFARTIDGLAGTSWTTTADAGTSWTWTAATRGRAHIDGGTGAGEQVIVTHATFLPNAEEYDLVVNIDVSSGDGSSTTTKQTVLRTGIDASNYASFHIRSDGAVEILWNYTAGGTSGSLLGVTAVAAIDATARTAGNLFLRVSRRLGRLVFSYGIGAGGGALPTAWVQVYISPDSIAAGALAASQGTWVGLILYTPSSMVADYEVDFTAIRSVIGGGPL